MNRKITELTELNATPAGADIVAIVDSPGGGAETKKITVTNLLGSAQPLDAQLTDVAGLAVTDGNFIVGNGANFVAENGATARTSLGLGDAATKTVGTANSNVIAVGGSGGVDLGGNALSNFDASVNEQTGTTYTLLASDLGKIVKFTSGSAITVTLPNNLGLGFTCTVIQYGAGQITFATSSSTLYNRQSHTKTAGQYGVVSLISCVADVFVLAGDSAS